MNQQRPNFIEAENVEEANAVDLSVYTFLKYSETKGVYVFKVRERKN